jgi:hypothetical protein
MTIFQRKAQLGVELLVGVYFSEADRQIIVAPNFVNNDGMYFEQESPVLLPLDTSLALLGHYTLRAFMAFDKHEWDGNPRKLSEWPAYKVSKAKSVKKFQERYMYMRIFTINANIRVEALPRHDAEIFVTRYVVSNDNQTFGKQIMDVYKCCQYLKDTYFI